jgi:molybdate transport system substrate-binding protein
MWTPKPFSLNALALLALAWLAVPAGAAGLIVLAPASAAAGAKALAAEYTASTGITVTFEGGARDKIFATLKAGDPADVVLLPTNDIIELPTVNGMTPLGRIVVGVAVKAGAPVPDVSTPEKFRRALLAAKGVAYADPAAGTSAGKVIAGMLAGPDFKGVKPVPVQGLAITALASGRASIALQMLPELAANKDVTLAGPIPGTYNASVDFSAGIAAASIDSMKALAFINFLTDPKAAAVWKANGLDLPGAH